MSKLKIPNVNLIGWENMKICFLLLACVLNKFIKIVGSQIEIEKILSLALFVLGHVIYNLKIWTN